MLGSFGPRTLSKHLVRIAEKSVVLILKTNILF
jgi:hypothetical protein